MSVSVVRKGGAGEQEYNEKRPMNKNRSYKTIPTQFPVFGGDWDRQRQQQWL